MSQLGKTPRQVIAKDHVPNIRASRIDDVTAWWTVLRVDASIEVMSASISAASILYASDRRKRIMGGDTKSNRRAWMTRRILQSNKEKARPVEGRVTLFGYTLRHFIPRIEPRLSNVRSTFHSAKE